MTLWNDMIIGSSLLLLVLLLWKEFRRTNRSRLSARVVASVLAVVGLACLALPLSYPQGKYNTFSGREGVLLTEGYDPDSLRQFLLAIRADGASSGKDVRVFSVMDGQEITALSSMADRSRVADGFPTVDAERNSGLAGLVKLHVLGYGLTREEWAALHPPPLVFHPSAVRAGILSVSWKQKLLPGEKLRVQGSVTPGAGGPVKLILTGMGIHLDSTTILKQTDFELNTVPAQSGRAEYRLLVVAGHAGSENNSAAPATVVRTAADTPEQELLPIEVLAGKKLKILLLAASPDFENSFLVNWLARNGHAVAIRTTISKGKYDKAYLNMPETSLDLLNPYLLDKFDVVIADAAALQAESSVETANLRRQVAEKGMGLIIKADSTAASSGGAAKFYKDLFSLETVNNPVQRLYIKDRSGTRSLLRDSLSRTTVSSGIYGAGKLIFTTLNTTYFQMMSGDKKEYAAYWSSLLQKVVREEESGEDWQFAPALPRVNEPVEVQLQTNKYEMPQGQFDNTAVYLAESPLLPFLWRGTYWPVMAGWHSSATLKGEAYWWYVWPAGSWQPVYRQQRRIETEEYIADQVRDAGIMNRDTATAQTVISGPESQRSEGRVFIAKAWFYVLFLLSCLFLWVEQKI